MFVKCIMVCDYVCLWFVVGMKIIDLMLENVCVIGCLIFDL